ncbi:hypothetical protein F4604DRAFT_1924788 [Suillus subluteus]|nr:hypothetical protein F4604DRAFT_1924788 [Suillus subluteus]
MHSREEDGITVEITQDLEASFVWALQLSNEPRDADSLLAGPESVSPDDAAAEFVALEEWKRTENFQSIDEVEVLEGNAFDFVFSGVPGLSVARCTKSNFLAAICYHFLQLRALFLVKSVPDLFREFASV